MEITEETKGLFSNLLTKINERTPFSSTEKEKKTPDTTTHICRKVETSTFSLCNGRPTISHYSI